MPEPAKVIAIYTDLRSKILAGDYRPGARLPTRAEMIDGYGVSSITVNSALQQLVEDGFVRPDGRRGSFVEDRPPHLTRFAVLLPDERQTPGQAPGGFGLAIREEAARLARDRGLEIGVITGTRGPELDALAADVEAERLAGVIFANHPFPWQGTPIVDREGIPRVAVMHDQHYRTVDAVWTDYRDLIARAFDHLRAAGRKRVAVLTHTDFNESDEMVAQLKPADVTIEPHWVQSVSLSATRWAWNSMRLLAHSGDDPAPDAVLVLDENLVQPALSGLRSAGLSVPGEIEVVAHCSFPRVAPSQPDVTWIGFPVDRVLERCVDQILARRADRPAQRMQLVPAVFERELGA